MKMETSKTLSRFMIGSNQLSPRYRGYEMTKKVRIIFSPRFNSLGLTLSADGAIISLRSRVFASYISCGNIDTPPVGMPPSLFLFLFKQSNMPMLFIFDLQ